MNRKVQLLSTPSSNTGSIRKALEFLDLNVFEVTDGARLLNGVRIVVPGVGTYAAAMEYLRRHKYVDQLKGFADDGVPIFGICLGMQILCNEGHEGGVSPGLGLLNGSVAPLPQIGNIKYNTGWRKVDFGSQREHTEFFFSHGYYVSGSDRSQVFATSKVGLNEIPAGLQSGSVTGVQYHPELSGLGGVNSIAGPLDLNL